MKLLFLDACMRGEKSRTKRICDKVIEEIKNKYPYIEIETADIKSIANIEKTVPSEWIVNDNTYVSDEFIKYARPLIMGEMNIIYKNGLPMHLKIK